MCLLVFMLHFKPKSVIYDNKLIRRISRLNPGKSTRSVRGRETCTKILLFFPAQQMLLLCQGINGSREDGPAPPSWSHKPSYPGEQVRKRVTQQSTLQTRLNKSEVNKVMKIKKFQLVILPSGLILTTNPPLHIFYHALQNLSTCCISHKYSYLLVGFPPNVP